MMDRVNKLRAWIYLRAPTDMWTESELLGISEAQVMELSEERLKVVAVAIIVFVATRGKEKALELAAELEEETGYGFGDFDAAKAEIAQVLVGIINPLGQAGAVPPQGSVPSEDVPGSR